MSTLPVLQLFLGLQLTASSQSRLCRRGEKFLNEISSLETQIHIPLHWSFAVADLLGNRSKAARNLISEIKERMHSREDIILPSGFSGCAHPYLLAEELKRELTWCYKNPWFPALKSVFAATPEVLFPVYPDVIREAVSGAYSKHDIRILGFPISVHRIAAGLARGDKTPRLLLGSRSLRIDEAGLKAVLKPFVLLHADTLARELEALPPVLTSLASLAPRVPRASAQNTGRLFILLESSRQELGGNETNHGALTRLIEFLHTHCNPRFFSFDPSAARRESTQIHPGNLLRFADPLYHQWRPQSRERIGQLRACRRKTNAQLRDVLETMAEKLPLERSTGAAITKNNESDIRITNVSMRGSVTLMGEKSRASFVEGRLSNLYVDGSGILTGRPAKAYLIYGKRRIYLQSESAFSFETDEHNGLRSTLTASLAGEREPLRTTVDYYFEKDEEGLSLDLAIRCPSWGEAIVDAIAPLELCLYSFGQDDNLYIDAQLSDGAVYRETIPARAAVKLLYAGRFLIGKNEERLSISFAGQPNGRIHCLEFLVKKNRGRFLLFANLGGSYLPQPAEKIVGSGMRFSYKIGKG